MTAALASFVKNLVENRDRKTGGRWNDEIKCLFDLTLDYGGPALAKIIREKLGGPCLATIYHTARCNCAIPNKLEEQIFQRAASFYKEFDAQVYSL